MKSICRHNNAATTVQKLHDKLAAYIWECHGWRGLGQVSQHYIRGKDMTGFAAGRLLAFDVQCHICAYRVAEQMHGLHWKVAVHTRLVCSQI